MLQRRWWVVQKYQEERSLALDLDLIYRNQVGILFVEKGMSTKNSSFPLNLQHPFPVIFKEILSQLSPFPKQNPIHSALQKGTQSFPSGEVPPRNRGFLPSQNLIPQMHLKCSLSCEERDFRTWAAIKLLICLGLRRTLNVLECASDLSDYAKISRIRTLTTVRISWGSFRRKFNVLWHMCVIW